LLNCKYFGVAAYSSTWIKLKKSIVFMSDRLS
jgi:hypothetical protein